MTLLLTILLSPEALAQTNLLPGIEQLSAQISNESSDVELRIQRGELYRRHGNLALSLILAGKDNHGNASFQIKEGLAIIPKETKLLGLAVDLALIQSDIRQAFVFMTRIPAPVLELPQWQFRQAVWSCIKGDEAVASSKFSTLVSSLAEEKNRAGTWQAPVETFARLAENPKSEECANSVKEMLAKRKPD